MSATEDFEFGEPVYRITRAQLIEDGRLFDLSTELPDLVARCGVRVHCAITDTATRAALWPIDDKAAGDALEAAGESLESRARRLLCAYVRSAIRQGAKLRGESTLFFAVTVLHVPNDWREIDLKAIVGPGDRGECVLTILLPTED